MASTVPGDTMKVCTPGMNGKRFLQEFLKTSRENADGAGIHEREKSFVTPSRARAFLFSLHAGASPGSH